MYTVLRMMWILVVTLLVRNGYCQDGFLNQDILRLQQYSMNEGQVDAIPSYSTNYIPREPTVQVASVNSQYQLSDDGYNNGDYSRAGRSRKVYRIKNPFQLQEEDKTLRDANISLDSATAGSNQYAAMQYSLPPEEFLQQMRADNQYQQQQQQQQQQMSTQVPASPFTVTPQPQYQYSTLAASNYDSNQQINQMSTVESKAFTPVYPSNTNAFQYNNQNSYNIDNTYSTPIPPYVSTALPNNQYIGTPTNTYSSSSPPVYVSTPQSSQYVSSPFSNINTGSLDYNNNRMTTVGSISLSYDANDINKRMQIDHYDNAINGIRYPSMHNQYQSNFSSSTTSPTSSPYTDTSRDIWQSYINTGYNALTKPEQSYSQTQYQNYKYNQQDSRFDIDSSNSDSYRIGSIPSANNLFLNFAQPDYQFLNSLKDRARDSKTETSQSDVYSHGDYGWKLSDKKSSLEPEISTNSNYFKYQIHSVQPETGAISQVSFQMDSRKPYSFEQNAKPVIEKVEAEEFTKAAAKAHENYKQQLEANKYLTNTQFNTNLLSNNLYHNSERQKNKLYGDNLNSNGQTQNEIVTASPFYYLNSKDGSDSTHKKPFDHDKALKNIVPIDVSNVVQNSDSQMKFEIDSNNRYSYPGFTKENAEQNLKSYSKPDPYYKERDYIYALSLKSKPDDSITFDRLKQFEQNVAYTKPQISDPFYSYGANAGNKRFGNESPQSLNFINQISNSHQDNTQSSANIHLQGIQRPQLSSDMNSLLKLNDIPYRLTQNLHNNFDQSNIPTPLPMRINQNVENHNVDIAAEILSKLMANKQNMIRPGMDSQSNNLLSTINGFKIANPFNVDLKLVAEMLRGKPSIDESQISSLRAEFNKPSPMKLDISQLQQLFQLKNDNILASNSGLGTYLDYYNTGRLPYQGVKYSRSEEDTENIPIADSSSNHPIGLVIEEDAINGQDLSDLTENTEDSISTNLDEDRPKNMISTSHKAFGDKHRHLSSSYSGRHSYKRKYPKSEIEEPYPLLKPPPPHNSRYRGTHTKAKNSIRRRINKPKMLRAYRTEPLFENITDDVKHMSNLKRSLTLEEDKSEISSDEDST